MVSSKVGIDDLGGSQVVGRCGISTVALGVSVICVLRLLYICDGLMRVGLSAMTTVLS